MEYRYTINVYNLAGDVEASANYETLWDALRVIEDLQENDNCIICLIDFFLMKSTKYFPKSTGLAPEYKYMGAW